jgi:DNA-binding IclR family transcriptional regulator
VVLPAKPGRPMLGLSIAATSERLSPARVRQLAEMLIEARLRV